MPIIKLNHVCSVSAEDKNHPAENLLSPDTYRKWQCSTPGEKQAIVVIEFDKASFIHSIDIGNNGSAFIEVLVGCSSSSEHYEVLLVASSFMSPAESKSWSNTNRVRMFSKDKLSKSVVDKKWDRVKLVCTQPFNKTEKYGISFVKFHSPPTDTNEEEATPSVAAEVTSKKIGGVFNLKAASPSNEAKGTLLFRREPLSTAAKVRQASNEALKSGSMSSPVKPVSQKSPRTSFSRKKSPDSDPREAPPTKKPKSDKSPLTPADILFEELLKGVVISLSGFQNPLRSELREKALEMGAEYKPDWEKGCTHLICAFEGTPKYNLVKSKNGLIVQKEWLLDCHKTKVRQPARKYRFKAKTKSESEEDKFYDNTENELFKNITYTKNNQQKNKTPPIQDDPYGGSTDEGSDMETGPPGRADTDECDTEDEINQVVKTRASEKQLKDNESSSSSSLLNLPSFLSDCYFFLYGDFSSNDRRIITRYITAYNGSIENYMSDKVTHVLTQEEWDENFDQAVSENSSLVFVEPKWIFACHGQHAKVPHHPFVISPS